MADPRQTSLFDPQAPQNGSGEKTEEARPVPAPANAAVRASLGVHDILFPDRAVYHGTKYAEFRRMKELLDLSAEQYETAIKKREGTVPVLKGERLPTPYEIARLADCVQGFQRNLREMAESLEASLDPAKQSMMLENVLVQFMENFVTNVSNEMKRLERETSGIDSANSEKHRRNIVATFKRIGDHLSVDHRELRRALGSITGGNMKRG